MDEVLTPSTLTGVALIVMLFEAVLLTVYLRRRGAQSVIPGTLSALAAGALLVLALRQALAGSNNNIIVLCLGLSLVAHLGELILKIRNLRANPDRGPAT
jgi:hypothetical protein